MLIFVAPSWIPAVTRPRRVPRVRRVPLVAAVAAALALGLVSGVPAAAADVVPVFTARGAVPGQPNVAFVKVTSDSAITSVVGTFASSADGTVTALRFAFDAASGEWRSPALTLSPAGYVVTATATDADGDVADRPFYFEFRLRAVFAEHAIATTPLDLEHRTVTATGRILYRDPRTGELVAPGSAVARVYLKAGGLPFSTLPSADGSYSVTGYPVELTGASAPVVITLGWYSSNTVAGDPEGGTDVIDSVSIPATSHPSRILLDRTSAKADYPEPVTIQGTLQRLLNGAWVTVPSAPIYLSDETDGDVHLTVTTDGAGRFSGDLPLYRTTRARVNLTGNARAYLNPPGSTPTVAELSAVVRPKVRLLVGRHSVDASRVVTLAGRLVASPDWPSGEIPPVRVRLQRSTNGTTGFTTVGSVPAYLDLFGGKVRVRNVGGYYRVYYPGSSALQPSYGSVFQLSRRETRITATSVAPTAVKKGRSITITGTAQKFDGTTFVGPGRAVTVKICFREWGSASTSTVTTVRTTISGRFKAAVVPAADGYWSARWYPSGTTLVNAIGPKTLVDVR
jgi:hypothetical protein